MNSPRILRLLAALALAASAAACRSSAPYTLPAAAINTALAAGVAAAQRSAGGCYAQCVGGTVCNPRTGFCESPAVVCVGAEADSLACLNRPGATMNTGTQGPGASPALPVPLGISPATGTVPPPPSGASPTPSITRP